MTLMVYAADGTAEYLGVLRIIGRIGDREGSLVVRTDGVFDGAAARTTWRIVEGSATDDLEGIRGTGHSVAPHGPDRTYSLELASD